MTLPKTIAAIIEKDLDNLYEQVTHLQQFDIEGYKSVCSRIAYRTAAFKYVNDTFDFVKWLTMHYVNWSSGEGVNWSRRFCIDASPIKFYTTEELYEIFIQSKQP